MTRSAALLACSLLFLATCGVMGENGSGKAKAEARQLEPFHEFELEGALSADISVGPSQAVEVSGDDNLVPLVRTKVKDGRLHVTTTKSMATKLPLRVRVSVPTLTAVSLSGAGHLTVRGSTPRIDFDLSGAGSVDAQDLKAEEARARVSGAGDIDLYASRALDVDVSGAGKVTYSGDPPNVTKDISGAGSLVKR